MAINNKRQFIGEPKRPLVSSRDGGKGQGYNLSNLNAKQNPHNEYQNSKSGGKETSCVCIRKEMSELPGVIIIFLYKLSFHIVI
jgi:hypothetical protein